MPDTKKNTVIALKKAQTSINTIVKMLEEDKYCIEILQQIRAVEGLVKSASNKILENHLNTCFSEGMSSKDSKVKEKYIKEVVDVLSLGNRS